MWAPLQLQGTCLIHLHKPSNVEIKDLVDNGEIESCSNATEVVSCGLFVPKKDDPFTGESQVTLVADFSSVNKTLERPQYPNEGSSSLLKMIKPSHKFSQPPQPPGTIRFISLRSIATSSQYFSCKVNTDFVVFLKAQTLLAKFSVL